MKESLNFDQKKKKLKIQIKIGGFFFEISSYIPNRQAICFGKKPQKVISSERPHVLFVASSSTCFLIWYLISAFVILRNHFSRSVVRSNFVVCFLSVHDALLSCVHLFSHTDSIRYS